MATPEMLVLKAYEQWEADLIMCNDAWENLTLPCLTWALWDRLLEIQSMRNAAIAANSHDALLAALRLADARFALLWPDRQPSDDAAWQAVHEAIGRATGNE